MGPTASQIREELDQHREDAADRLAELENRVGSVTDQARTQVEETTQQIRQGLDIKYQLRENPLIGVGVGLLAGFLLGGGLSGGGGGGSHRGHPGQRSSGVSGHLQATLMQSAKSSGLSDTISAAGSALMSEVTKTVKGAVGSSGQH